VPFKPGVENTYVKVVSTGFWENFAEVEDTGIEEEGPCPLRLSEGFYPGDDLKQTLSEYVNHYKKYKSLRTLIFRQDLGRVELTLSFSNGDYKFKVTPLQASVIEQFGSEDGQEIVTLSLEHLQHVLSNANNDQ